MEALRTVGGLLESTVRLQTNTYNPETVTLGNGTVVHNGLSPGRIRIETASAPTLHFSESSLPNDPRRENPTWRAVLGEGPCCDHGRGHSCLPTRNTCGEEQNPMIWVSKKDTTQEHTHTGKSLNKNIFPKCKFFIQKSQKYQSNPAL